MRDIPLPSDGEVLAHDVWVRGLVRTLVRDRSLADDVLQDVREAQVRARPERILDLRSWLGGVVRHKARQHLRADRRREALEARCRSEEHAPSTADLVARAEVLRTVSKAVLDLPDPYRAVLLLRYHEGWPARKIASARQTDVVSIDNQIRQGLRLLRPILEQRLGGNWLMVLSPVAFPLKSAAVSVGTIAIMTKTVALPITLLIVALGIGFSVNRADKEPAPALSQRVDAKAHLEAAGIENASDTAADLGAVREELVHEPSESGAARRTARPIRVLAEGTAAVNADLVLFDPVTGEEVFRQRTDEEGNCSIPLDLPENPIWTVTHERGSTTWSGAGRLDGALEVPVALELRPDSVDLVVVARADVRARADEPVRFFNGADTATVQTDSQGIAIYHGVTPGERHVLLAASGDSQVSGVFDLKAGTPVVSVLEGGSVTVRVRLMPSRAYGNVANLRVRLAETSSFSRAFPAWAVSNDQGVAVFEHVPAGVHQVSIGVFDDLHRTFAPVATRLEVADRNREIEISVEEAPILTLRVESSDGEPVSALLRIHTATGGVLGNGVPMLTGPGPGPHEVRLPAGRSIITVVNADHGWASFTVVSNSGDTFARSVTLAHDVARPVMRVAVPASGSYAAARIFVLQNERGHRVWVSDVVAGGPESGEIEEEVEEQIEEDEFESSADPVERKVEASSAAPRLVQVHGLPTGRYTASLYSTTGLIAEIGFMHSAGILQAFPATGQ